MPTEQLKLIIDALKKGEEATISGIRVFPKEKMINKVQYLNGSAEFYKVVEVEIPENGCKFNSNENNVEWIMIPHTLNARVGACHDVIGFLMQ
jgi:hypothetical protein